MNADVQPPQTVFAAALQWLQATAIGTVGTSVAVIAVASVGFLLLSGRIDVRRGVRVIIGCFILFGAPSIAVGIMHAVSASGETDQVQPTPAPPPGVYAPAPHQTAPSAPPYDPYAGAALPTR
jgi:type IV secretory pathway VirB2 component (pilin)